MLRREEPDLLASRRPFHDDFIPSMIPNHALGFAAWQGNGRHLVWIVHPPSDEWPIRVAFLKTHHHLLADMGDEHPAPVLAAPRLGDANPARGIVIALGVSVPMELHLDPSELI